MPIYSIQGPDGKIYEIEGPAGATKAQVVAAIQAKMQVPAPAPAPVAPIIAPSPSTERTAGEAFKDIGASVVGGFGSLLQVPGQLAQLVPGLQGVGQALAKPGEFLEEKGESLKSQGLKVREALRSQAISEAEKEGILSSFATAIIETIKDPALLSTFITRQLPQLLGPAAAAKVGKAVVLSRSGLEGAELAAQAGKIGTRSAIGAGAAMQGADISADAYKQALEAAQKQGMSEEDANAAALLAARKAFALATPISLASQYLPGGAAIERRLAGVAGTGRIKSALGEAVSEAIEEGGGAFATNVGVLGVDPTRELTQGVGAAAGLGTIGGGILGGVLGKAPAPELPPEVRPGETDRQAAERIQAELLAMKEAAKPPAPGPILDTNNLYNLMAQPNGYALVEQYKQRLAQLPETKETKAAIDEASFIQRRSIIEGLERQPTKAVLTDKTLKQMGFKPKDGVYDSLLGKDMASPDQAEEITQTLSSAKAQEGITPAFVGRIDNAINVVNDLQQRVYPKEKEEVAEKAPAPPPAPSPVLDTNNLYNLMAQPNGYALVEQYKQRLTELPQTQETKSAIDEASFIQRRSVIESLGRQPTTAVLNDKALKNSGFKPKDGVYEALLGKDIANPDEADTVNQSLTTIKAKEGVSPSLVGKIDNFLVTLNEFQDSIYPRGKDAGQAITPPSGEGVQVAGEPGAGISAERPATPVPGGVVPAVEDVGQPAGGEAAKPVAVAAPPVAPSPAVAETPAVAPAIAQAAEVAGPPAEKTKPSKGPTLIQQTEAFGQAIGAVRPYRGALEGRKNLPAEKAVQTGDFQGVVNALEGSKNVTVAEVARKAKDLDTNIVLDDDAAEVYARQSPLMRQLSIDGAKMHLEALEKIRALAPQVDALPDGSSLWQLGENTPTAQTIEGIDNGEPTGSVSLARIADSGHSMFAPLPTGPIKLRTKEDFKALQRAFEDVTQEVGEEPLRLTSTGSAKVVGVAGVYDEKSNTIRVPSYAARREDVLAHEIVHAQTVKAIANPTKAQRPAVQRLENLHQHVKAKLEEKAKADENFRMPYGIESLQEFVAEGMANPRFQFELNQIEYKSRTAWDAFVQTVADLLGIQKNTAFTELLGIYGQLTAPTPPKVIKTAAAKKHPATVMGSPLLALVSRRLNGLDPALMSEFSTRFITKQLDKSGRPIVRTRNPMVTGFGNLFREGGTGDYVEIATMLEEEGYLEPGAVERDYKEAGERAKDLIKAALNREEVQTLDEQREEQLRSEEESARLQQEDEERRAAAEEKAAEQALEEGSEQTDAEFEAGLRGMGFTEEEIAQELEGRKAKPAKKSLVEMRKRYEAARAAPASVETKPEPTELDKEIQAKIEELGRVLSRILGKFGLKDVALNLVEDMKAEGEYAQSVIRLALDAASPVQALRHESIHALKELGFFTPQQWAALEKQAKSKWVDQYLKNVNINKEPLGEGEKSRYDAYSDLFKSQGLSDAAIEEAIREEAIADAFGDFDVNKAPPGLMQALLNRLRNFFDAVKTAFGGEITAEQVFRKVEKGELKAEAAPAEAGAKPSLRKPGEPVTRENVLGAMERAQEAQPYMNCQLCVQMATGVTKLRDLPKVKEAKIGDVYTFGETKDMAAHYAIEVGNGNVAEVEQWGEKVRVIPLSQVIDEYGDPSAIRRPPETAYSAKVKPSLRELVPELKAQGVTEKALQQFLKYKAADRRVGFDELSAKPSDKAARSRALRSFFDEMGGVDSLGARKAFNSLANAYDMRGEESLFIKPDIRYSLRDSIGLYSELENKVAQGPNKAPAASWKAYINGLTQKGVKPEEIEWSGVRDWLDLQTGPVSKDAVNAYLKQGGVKVEEVVLGGRTPWRERLDLLENRGVRNLNADEREELNNLRERFDEEGPTPEPEEAQARYGQYTLPGGENYREVLLTLPSKIGTVDIEGWTAKVKRPVSPVTRKPEYEIFDASGKSVGTVYTEEQELDAIKTLARRIAQDKTEKQQFKSTHWEQPNVLAHIRLNDRTDADGNKVLFVEEIQSDWGQEGKKKGFGAGDWEAPFREWERGIRERAKTFYFDPTDTAEEQATALRMGKKLASREDLGSIATVMGERKQMEEAWAKSMALQKRVPAAPFVTKTEGWLNLALKRIMVMAAEGGYDKVAFVNGEQSADRYDLSKQVESIQWAKGPKGYSISAFQGGNEVTRKDGLSESDLEDVVGKEIAQKIVNGVGADAMRNTPREMLFGAGNVGLLRGLDLKVGGEGMKAFYNQIVPLAVKKLLPKVGGGQMGMVEFGKEDWIVRDRNDDVIAEGFSSEENARQYAADYSGATVRNEGGPGEQPGFSVTPDMKQKVETTGLPRFSLRSTIPTATRQRIVQTTISRDEKTFYQRIIEAISPNNFQSFRADALNRYDQLSVYDKKLAQKMGGKALLASSSAESAALFSDLGAGLTASALGVHDRMGGVPVYRNGVTIISNKNGTVKGPTAIFAPLAKQSGDYQAYQYWAGVKRGSRFLADGREQLFEPADIKKAEDLRKQYLKDGIDFNNIQKEWTKFNDGLVDYMVATGVLSKERADIYKKHSDYLPFYRQMDGVETVGPKIFQAISGVKPPKKLKGGEAPIDDFLENIVRNTQSAIQAGIKNIAAQRAADVAVKIQMADRLDYHSTAPNVFHVYENGKPVSYVTQDQLFINAVKSLGLPDLPFIGLFSGPANLLRNLVTKDPGFMLANLMRDSMSAWVTSGVKMKPMVDTISNFGSAIAGKSPEFQALMNSGILGGYEFSQNVEQSGREFGKALRKQANVKQPGMKGVLEMGAKPFTSLWEALEKGSTASDAATRMEVYKRTLAETGNEAEALYRALEVMNFNRKGSSAVVRVLTAAVPFLNARMQGLDVLYRAATGKMNVADAKQVQRNFFIRGATIAALSTLYWALTHDDDEYKKQEQETRDNYWLLPSLGVKIPIPFEIGVLFKVIPERILGYTMGSDTGEDFLKSMARQLTSTLAFNPIPQTVLPVVESMTNFSFFTMRPVVGQGLEGLQPAYQVGPGTSRLAETIGGATKSLPTELQISPAKLDNLINGYTGTMGMYMVNLMDAIFDMNTDSPKPSRRFEQMPLIRRFAIDPEARGSVTAYYELKNSVDAIVRTSNMLERTMNYEELPGYLRDNARMLASKDYILDLEKTMKEFREMKTLVRSAKMEADAKRDSIASIEKMENQLTANIQYLKRIAKGG